MFENLTDSESPSYAPAKIDPALPPWLPIIAMILIPVCFGGIGAVANRFIPGQSGPEELSASRALLTTAWCSMATLSAGGGLVLVMLIEWLSIFRWIRKDKWFETGKEVASKRVDNMGIEALQTEITNMELEIRNRFSSRASVFFVLSALVVVFGVVWYLINENLIGQTAIPFSTLFYWCGLVILATTINISIYWLGWNRALVSIGEWKEVAISCLLPKAASEKTETTSNGKNPGNSENQVQTDSSVDEASPRSRKRKVR